MYMYPFTGYQPDVPKVTHGKGIWLFDENGKGYIDSTSGPMTVNLGHCHPDIIAAMQDQIKRLHFAYRFHFRSDEAEQLAARLVALSDDNKGYAFFMNSGSEASEAAYRIAMDYFRIKGNNKKTLALGRRISNHGNTIQSLTYGDDRARKVNLLNKVIDPAVSDLRLPPYYDLHKPAGCSSDEWLRVCLSETFETIDQIGAEHIACVFAEPITASSGGVLIPHPDYFRELKAGLKARDILLIADEIVTGLGRTGEWFNMRKWETESDITIIGKGLGAGFTPISGVMISKQIGDSLASLSPPHFVGHTYSGNPLSAGVALAVLDTLENKIGMASIRARGSYFGRLLQEMLGDADIIADIRGQGLLWAVETTLGRQRAEEFVQAGHQQGINLYPCRLSGKDGDALTFLFTPPLVISESEMDELVGRFSRVLSRMA
ncbi:aminotransferase class III-fold pyridoxal phosphate-dependent enzyme [Xenorhabdus bovienii]|uniref:aminotransferase family protein n=1 Tax=Xenorhabdus bovienii TaxID=40576 RepID=UPI0023B2EC51|nr:aminotransferase class III-fold pyridoxal phosphate-dependent enzyme [Xenorhabdus bovienii]MDE9447139.1 aminotransferase class III-fold pyridoxal phosphate-dependent enzyme [Xenorhabdus bovienii]MDE9519316.1 aminotransferase class III-fold pyridoxal phosphate-dependent enzyme [Xenorhabdus bovienii]MDE9536413.1 aminotransferase class III-fold pyridoxal phosphate-dependent enzyme [Xenorhabdus bovienii]MDE9589593.1 aminotransferase class III-fold pyridoxal phosphate-dependent enzyme [Xenorhabdu